MDSSRPINVVAGSAVAVIGGLVAIAFMAIKLNGVRADNTIVFAAVTMLIAVLFFAMAGSLYSNAKTDYLPMVIIGLINVAVIAAMIVLDVKANVVFGGILLAIAIIVELLVLPAVTEKWVAYDRV